MKIMALINKDAEVRKNSSSGGAFYLLAEKIISEGGVVFGAEYDENFEVVHGYTETLEGVRKFMTSKYVQSLAGTAYKDAETFLKAGRKVLFTGTPCQVAALKAYLKKDYNNLMTLDFICHGVPSRRVWREYKEELSKGKQIEAVNFRDKTSGWRLLSLKVTYTDKSYYIKDLRTDIYTKGFLSNLYLRPSCYDCKFRGIDRASDVTVADFWGIHVEIPELFDDKGASAVIVRSDEVLDIIEENKENLVIREVPEEMVVRGNAALYKSCRPHRKREEFFAKKYKSTIKHINRYVKDTPVRKIKQKLYFLKKKLMG